MTCVLSINDVREWAKHLLYGASRTFVFNITFKGCMFTPTKVSPRYRSVADRRGVYITQQAGLPTVMILTPSTPVVKRLSTVILRVR